MEENRFQYLDRNYAEICSGIEKAARECGRDPKEILITAAAKSGSVEEIAYLHAKYGLSDIGENRVQQLLSRYDTLPEGMQVHFIGSLQRNKVKYMIDKVAMIHSVDSLALAEEIGKRAGEKGITMKILIEINSGLEENKGGVSFEEAEALAVRVDGIPGIALVGFMTMAPRCDSEAEYRSYFAATKAAADRIFQKILGRKEKPVLSMGMSESYLPAVLEGATLVRVGRSLFRKPEQENS